MFQKVIYDCFETNESMNKIYDLMRYRMVSMCLWIVLNQFLQEMRPKSIKFVKIDSKSSISYIIVFDIYLIDAQLKAYYL